MAAEGRFPAIDVLKSLSRVMSDIVSVEHMGLANKGRSLFAKYEAVRLLVQIGEYQSGSDREADKAIKRIGPLRDMICGNHENDESSLIATLKAMKKVIAN